MNYSLKPIVHYSSIFSATLGFLIQTLLRTSLPNHSIIVTTIRVRVRVRVYLYNPPVRPPKRQPLAFPLHVISGAARASEQKGNRSAMKATVPPSNRQSPFKHTHSPFKS